MTDTIPARRRLSPHRAASRTVLYAVLGFLSLKLLMLIH